MHPEVTRQKAGYLISQLMPFIIQGVHLEFLAKKTITQTQFLVLVAIFSKHRSTMKNLADNMHVSMPTMSGIVDRLVKSGYIKRQEDQKDRRQVTIELSVKGERLIKQFQSIISRRWQEVLQSLSEKDVKSFFDVVTKLKNALQIKKK